MKLLLTSAGITNRSIADALVDLVGKKMDEIKIGFVPTAANIEGDNKVDWFLSQLTNPLRFGFGWIDVIDFSAAEVDWEIRLGEVDVILMGGGNTFHLLDQVRKNGIGDWVKEHFDNKVYIGISAGSILATPTIEVALIPPADENFPNITDFTGMGWVDFEIEPHCEGQRFETMKQYAAEKKRKIYAINDQTAIKVIDESIEVITEGRWELYN